MNSVGPYTNVSYDTTIKFGYRHFKIILYGAYNALGLIGSEKNGIAILDETLMQVVLDEHCCESSGYYGPSKEQVDEFNRIANLSESEFVEFVNSHPRTREPIEIKIRAKRKPKFEINNYIKLAKQKVSYNSELKSEFLRQGEQLAYIVASKLGLNEDQYDIRVNKGGVAVSGEVTLHTDNIYVQFGQNFNNTGILCRTCNGRKDYTGGRNHTYTWDALKDLNKFVKFLLSL